MTVLLTILKITGIVLLILLGVILTAALLLLFIPVRYRADGGYEEKLYATLRLTWLMHLISFRAAFDGGFTYSVKVAGIGLLPSAAKEKGKKRGEPADALSEEAEAAQPVTVEKVLEEHRTEEERTEETGTKGAAAPESGRHAGADAEPEERADKPGLTDRLRRMIEKIKLKLRSLFSSVRRLLEQISWYKAVFEKEEVKRAVHLSLEQLKRMLRHILPRKTEIFMIIGTGDPASTGQLMALQGILYPVLQSHSRVCIVPDFEDKHFEGTFHIKGHVTACRLIICALRIFFSRDIRYTVKLLRKKEEA